MNKKLTQILVHICVFTCIIIPIFAHGDSISNDTQITIKNPFNCGQTNSSGGGCTLPTFIDAVLQNIIMPIAAIVAVMYIVWAGFLYVTAQGNPKKIADAHQNLLYALIGTGILLGAAGISAVISNTVKSLITP